MAEQEITMCPWCDSEIVWDPELGPESHCPHCDNELSNYRTMSLGDEDGLQEEIPGEDEDAEIIEADEVEWGDILNDDGFRQGDLAYLEIEEKVEQILDQQDEVPECPSCREYMLLAGTQTIQDGFESVIPAALNRPLVELPVQLSMYVCPACFETSTKLSTTSRDRFIQALGGK